jgi:multisubunit Na+/H+ antiporter MnhG subunit
MDAFFGNTSMVLLILLAVCCEPVGLILGIIGLVTCKDPVAKNNALIVTIIGAILTFLGSGGIVINLGGH